MVDQHYGGVDVLADELDDMIAQAENRNPGGTFDDGGRDESAPPEKVAQIQAPERAGDRGRTGDVQLGKLAFFR